MIIRLHRGRSRRQTACAVRAAAAEELVDPDPSFRIEKVPHSASAPSRFGGASQGSAFPHRGTNAYNGLVEHDECLQLHGLSG